MDVPIDVTGITITTERLRLRALAPGDLEDMYAYASVPGVGEMAGWKHHESIEETEAILRSMIEEKEVLALMYQADGKMIGTLGLHRSWANQEEAYKHYKVKEIGYVLAKAYWGKGLMPEAVKAVIDYSFHTLGLDALTCCHFMENNQSRRVIEKCGFQFVKQSQFEAAQLNRMIDDMQYILLASDWG